ncbi:MAG: hypothetical protein WA642_20190 [Steroidobacteraceae bacterium]
MTTIKAISGAGTRRRKRAPKIRMPSANSAKPAVAGLTVGNAWMSDQSFS